MKHNTHPTTRTSSRRLKRRWSIPALTATGLLTLTGCFATDVTLDTAADGTVSGGWTMTVDESTLDWMGVDSPDDLDYDRTIPNALGGTCSATRTHQAEKIVVDCSIPGGTDLSPEASGLIAQDADDGSAYWPWFVTVERSGDDLIIDFDNDRDDVLADADADDLSAGMLDLLPNDAGAITVTVATPGPIHTITETGGNVRHTSTDDNTITVYGNALEDFGLEVIATAEPGNGNGNDSTAVLAVLIIGTLAVTAALVLARTRRLNQTFSEDLQQRSASPHGD